jgi:hypothetical protein
MILDVFLQWLKQLIICIIIIISQLCGSSLLPSYLHGSPGAGRRVGGAGQEARSGQTSAQEDTLYIPVIFLIVDKIETSLFCFVFLNYYENHIVVELKSLFDFVTCMCVLTM